MQFFYEINICHVMIFSLYAIYSKHEMTKIGNQTSEKSKYYRKGSNNFAADCNLSAKKCLNGVWNIFTS